MYRPNVKAYVQSLDWSHSAVGRDNILFLSLKSPPFSNITVLSSSVRTKEIVLLYEVDTVLEGFFGKTVPTFCMCVEGSSPYL